MKRFVVMGLVLVVLIGIAIVLLARDAGPRVDVSHLVPLADQTMLVFVNEYYYDFERRYASLEESEALEAGACASGLLFEAERDGCVESWAARRFDFTTENSTGFLTYLIFESGEHASLFLNETLERAMDTVDPIPLIRYDTAGISGFASHALGSDLDELLALVVESEEGRLFVLAQRMDQIVLVSFEETAQRRLDRRFLFTTTRSDHEPAITYYNLSYEDL